LQQFEQMPGAAGATYADEHRYVLQALLLQMKISVCYRHRVCRWTSVRATVTESVVEYQCLLQAQKPVDEHCMRCTTGTWSVVEYQHLLQTDSVDEYCMHCTTGTCSVVEYQHLLQTDSVDEHCMHCTTGTWSVDEYQYSLWTPICRRKWVFATDTGLFHKHRLVLQAPVL
jgi:hypothetical protein